MKIKEEQKVKMIEKIEATRTKNSIQVTPEDIKYLVDKFCEMIESGVSQGEATRLTYACLYQQSDMQFNPQARIAELKAQETK